MFGKLKGIQDVHRRQGRHSRRAAQLPYWRTLTAVQAAQRDPTRVIGSTLRDALNTTVGSRNRKGDCRRTGKRRGTCPGSARADRTDRVPAAARPDAGAAYAGSASTRAGRRGRYCSGQGDYRRVGN
jgi:hypothetical protein